MPSSPQPDSRTLRLTRSEVVCGLGICLFCISLAAPALKHGKDNLGIECFILGLVSIFDQADSRVATQRQLMAIAAHFMHAIAMVPTLIVWNRKRVGLAWKVIPASLIGLSILFLLTVPYDNIERVYWGYYIWLLAMGMMAWSPFLDSTA